MSTIKKTTYYCITFSAAMHGETRAVTEVKNAPEICLKTSTCTSFVFNVKLDMMAPINSKTQK